MLVRDFTEAAMREALESVQVGSHAVIRVLYPDVARAATLAAILGWRVEAAWSQDGLPYRNLVVTSLLLRHCPP